MELSKEITRKLFLLLFIFGLLFEIALIALILNIFKRPLINSINEIIQFIELTMLSLNEKLNLNCNSLIYKYIIDLKLIAKHTIVYQKGSNFNSTFYLNYKYRKKIISATDYKYPNKTLTNQYYEELKGFNYLEKLEKKFKNSDHNEIINKLFNEDEFDLIGIYTNKTLSEYEIINSFYFISILKSIYIRRFIIKRNETDYIRFIIKQSDISLIYPYDRYNNSMTISLFEKNISLLHKYNSNLCQKFILFHNPNHFTFYSHLTKDFIVFCLVAFLNEEDTTSDKATSICLEINTTNFLHGFIWKDQTELELSIVFLNNNEIEPIYHENSEYYQMIKNAFKSEVFGEYQFTDKMKLFHLIYYRLFSKYKSSNFTQDFIEDVIVEYQIINQIIIEKINQIEETYCNNTNNENQVHNMSFEITKTECYRNPGNHKIECGKDKAKVIIYAFIMETKQLDMENLIDVEDRSNIYPIFYSLSIIESNPEITRKKMVIMMGNKIAKLFFFFVFSQLILIVFIWLLMIIINSILLSPIDQIINGLKVFDEIIGESKNININKILKYENKILISNKEMRVLSNISNNIKKMIILQFVMNNNNNKYLSNSRICNIILKMKDSPAKEVCLTLIAYHHFKQSSYSMAENEFNLILNNIIHKEKKLIFKNDNINSELKNIIKRFNDITYLNENSILKGINETILPNIKIMFLKQKIVYLHGMCLYNEGKENIQKPKKSTNNNNINNLNKLNDNNYNQNNIDNYFIKAIKDFEECRNINKSLGSNPIKEIFSLIMISKCNIQLKEYKKAISSINDALDLYFELEKIFKDTNIISFNPCFMLFILNIIFQTIMYTLVRISYFTYKYHSCIYLILKIFDTSPFIVKNIFYNCSFILQSIINKTKLKRNSIIYDNTKKLYSKIFKRLFIKYFSNDINEINRIKLKYALLFNRRRSAKIDLISNTNKISLMESSEQKKGSQKFLSSISMINNNSYNKLINICVSEKILSKNNGIILKDVIIDCIEECFYDNNENDKFSYVQFSCNGKKDFFIKPKTKEIFLQKLKIDNIEKENDNFYNLDNTFNEFYNLLNDFIELGKSINDDSISNNHKFNNDDNIILMFINSEDIRFDDKEDCKKIVYELNKNNFSLYLISYEDIISPDKIKNIKSFMSGLFDAHFFQIKNYQQIKQIFINISTKKIEEDVIDYNYENIDFIL